MKQTKQEQLTQQNTINNFTNTIYKLGLIAQQMNAGLREDEVFDLSIRPVQGLASERSKWTKQESLCASERQCLGANYQSDAMTGADLHFS